jgi:hypothetical protein
MYMERSRRIIDLDDAGNVRSVQPQGARDARQRLKQLAWLLDSSIPIPGTRFTVGLEALIGLFPFIGDLVGVALSSFILKEAARLGVPKSVLMRMTFNVAIEGIVGMVPLAGDVFDAAFKANQRNVRLLESWLDDPKRTVRSSRFVGAALVGGVIAFLLLLAILGALVVRWIVGSFS